MNDVALPGCAIGDGGDLNIGRRGERGPAAALFGGKIHADAHGISPGTIPHAESGRMPAGLESRRQFAVDMPAIASGAAQENGMGAIGADAREDLGGGEIGARAFKPNGYVVVIGGGEFAVAGNGVFDGGEIGGGTGGVFDFEPAAVAGDVGAMVQHALQLHTGETGGAAHGEQASGVGSDPVIELAAELGGFVELHDGLGGRIGAIVGDEGFDADHVGGELADFFEGQEGVFQVIEHAEEHDDIEVAEGGGREAANVGNAVIGAGCEQVAGDAEALEGSGIHGGNLGTAAFEFESEPAIPCADIEGALAMQIGGDGELSEAMAENFEGLKAGDDAAIGQLHAVIPAEAGEFFQFLPVRVGGGRGEGRGGWRLIH